jgi:hypothetical protein
MNEGNGIWLPAEIWALDLPPLHRVFLARLAALSKQDGASWAGDEFLAESLRCTPQHVRKMRRQLEDSGHIVTEGYGYKRRLTVEVAPTGARVAPTGTSNHRRKQPQAQELQPEAQKLQPEMRQEATTVAESIEENRNSVEVVKSKEPKPKKAKRERVFHDVVMPYDTDTFRAAWREWLDYKWDQHRFAFKQPRYEQTALHNLQKDSNGNEELAIHIIATSIASGWKGLIANSAKSYKGPRTGRSGYFHSSGKYAHPADVLKDRDIWG